MFVILLSPLLSVESPLDFLLPFGVAE